MNRCVETLDVLRSFELDGIKDTGRTVGVGVFASVKELEFHGTKCAGKGIHPHLYESATPEETAAMMKRLAAQSTLLSRLRHPCIVLFLGVYFAPGQKLPVLVMECLHTTLSTCLYSYGVLPNEVSYRIMRDVALGLRYLHQRSPPIVHGEIATANVLLASNMNAKLAYHGVSEILNHSCSQNAEMNSFHYPPEFSKHQLVCTKMSDVFSYGVLTIHVLTGRFEIRLKTNSVHDFACEDAHTSVAEVERFSKYLQEIGPSHPLMSLICNCLSNEPSSRPDTSEILSTVGAVIEDTPCSFKDKVEVIQLVRAKTRETELLKAESDSLKNELESVRWQMERLSVEQVTTSGQQHLLQPQTKLTWKWHSELSAGMDRPQTVCVKGKIYMGGGFASNTDDNFHLCQYDPDQQMWHFHCRSPVRSFALSHFDNNLVTVGGVEAGGTITDKLYRYVGGPREWEEFLTGMPTPRYGLSVITTKLAMVAIGGVVNSNSGHCPCETVEVYATETSSWHTADPLPAPSYSMSSVLIGSTCYLLGGENEPDASTQAVLSANISSLTQKATAPVKQGSQASCSPTWTALPDTPLVGSTAASIGGCLMAIGGFDGKDKALASVFTLLTDRWVRVRSGDLPVAAYGQSAVELMDNGLLVCGGSNNEGKLTSVYLASICTGEQ